MDGGLGGRQGEDQPAATAVDRLESQHLRQEGPIGVSIVAVENEVGTEDHRTIVPDVD